MYIVVMSTESQMSKKIVLVLQVTTHNFFYKNVFVLCKLFTVNFVIKLSYKHNIIIHIINTFR